MMVGYGNTLYVLVSAVVQGTRHIQVLLFFLVCAITLSFCIGPKNFDSYAQYTQYRTSIIVQ